MSDETSVVTTLLLFVGRCLLSDGKTEGRAFYQITEEEMNRGEISGEPRGVVLGSKGCPMGGSPGMIYRVEQPADSPQQFYVNTAKYAGRWSDEERCSEWQIADQANGQRIKLIREEKKGRNHDSILGCLEPIRRAYQRARGLQRNLILARAIYYITR